MEMDEINETNLMRQWKIITIIDARLNRVFNRHSQVHAYKRGRTLDNNYDQLVFWLGLSGRINENLNAKAKILDKSLWSLCGPDLRSSIGRTTAMVADIRQTETDALLKRYQFKYDRVKQIPDVRKCDALEAESEKLKADLDVMKQQNQAFEASQGANVQLLFAKLEQAKEKLRLFVEQERLEEQWQQQQETQDQGGMQQNDGQIGMLAAGTSQSMVEANGVSQTTDEDGRPLSPLSPIKIDEPLSIPLYSHNYIGNSNFPAWPKARSASSASDKFDSFEDTRYNKPFNARITPKTYSSKGKSVKSQLICDSSTAAEQKDSIPLNEEQIDSSSGIRCDDVLMDWPEDKNDAIEYPAVPDSTTPQLVNAQDKSRELFPTTSLSAESTLSIPNASLRHSNDIMMMEMGVDSGGLIHDAISSSSENNYPSAEKNDCSDVMSDDNACGLFVDARFEPLQHRPLEDNDDYPVYDVANRRIVETITIDDSGSDSDVEIIKN